MGYLRLDNQGKDQGIFPKIHTFLEPCFSSLFFFRAYVMGVYCKIFILARLNMLDFQFLTWKYPLIESPKKCPLLDVRFKAD